MGNICFDFVVSEMHLVYYEIKCVSVFCEDKTRVAVGNLGKGKNFWMQVLVII